MLRDVLICGVCVVGGLELPPVLVDSQFEHVESSREVIVI